MEVEILVLSEGWPLSQGAGSRNIRREVPRAKTKLFHLLPPNVSPNKLRPKRLLKSSHMGGSGEGIFNFLGNIRYLYFITFV